MYDPRQHHRRSVRLKHHDYASDGAYFVTLCSADKRCIFGNIEHGEMMLNWVGKIVATQWLQSAELRKEINLDTWQIMPNHFHAIVWIDSVGTHGNASETSASEINDDKKRAHCHAPLRAPRSLSSLIGGFKGAVTREINRERHVRGQSQVEVWQSSFYDRCIRDEKELDSIRRYIIENSLHWEHDDYAP